MVGACAAGIVLALTNLDAFRTVELKTYDWRLARTADPSAARKDIALVEIDEYSLRNLQQHAGKWPWPRVVHASLIDYLNRGKPTLIACDVLFADEDLRVGFPYGGDTWSGAESDKALADTIKRAGNVVLLTDATFVGETTEKQPLPDQGYHLNVPGVLERHVVFPPAGPLSGAAAALGHNFLSLDPDGPVRHVVPFVRSADRAMPSLGLSAALRASGIHPSAVRIEGQSLIAGERMMPLEMRKVNTEGGVTGMLWGLIHFRGPAFLPDMKRRPYPHYSFFDLLYSEEQLLAGQKPDVDPAVFKDKIVFVYGSGSTILILMIVRRTRFVRTSTTRSSGTTSLSRIQFKWRCLPKKEAWCQCTPLSAPRRSRRRGFSRCSLPKSVQHSSLSRDPCSTLPARQLFVRVRRAGRSS